MDFKSFRQGLLFEKTFSRREVWSSSKDGTHAYDHHGAVDGHHVHVEFDHVMGNSYNANFSVNKSHDHEHGAKDLKVNLAVLHHVHKVVNTFVREKKPDALHFLARDSNADRAGKKQQTYNKFAQRLGKQHGAKVETSPYHASLHF